MIDERAFNRVAEKLPVLAFLAVEVHAGRFTGFDFPGFDQRQFILTAHFYHKIYETGDRKLLHMGLRSVRDFNIKHRGTG